MIAPIIVLAVLAASYVGMAVASLTASLVAFCVLAAVSYAAAEVVTQRYPVAAAWLNRGLLLGAGPQFALRELFVLVLAARLGFSGWPLVCLLGSFTVLQGLRPAYAAAQAVMKRRRRLPVEWRNLDLPKLEQPPPALRGLARAGTRWVLFLDVLPLCGLVALQAGAPLAVLAVLAVVSVLLAVAFPAAAAADRRAMSRYPSDEEVSRTVRAAAEAYAPEVVAYFSSRDGTEFLLNVWVSTYERLSCRTIIYLRERVHLDRIGPTSLPIVVLPRGVDLEYFHLPSLKVALYSTTTTKNNHMIRLPGTKDVFVGHGDSDKGSSFNPLSRLYDEVWVAGPAGRDRYLHADVGVRDEQVREVGRPQLVELRKGRSGPGETERPTVLYAPTWEGANMTLAYSSLAAMGERIVTGLLAADPPVLVLFKPHPSTGHKAREYAHALARVTELVRAAGGEHEVIDTTEGLYDAFNRADVLVSDVSSVITDFLYSGKPYVVTNPRGDDQAEFTQAFPSAAGAYLLGPDCAGLVDAVRDAVTHDSLAERRSRVAGYLLGDIESDPIQRFDEAVSALVAQQAAEDAETGYAPGWYDTVGTR